MNTGKARARSGTGEIKVATYNVCTLSLTGKNRAGHAEVVLQKCRAGECEVIGLQKTRVGRTEFIAARYRVVYCGSEGGKGRAGQHGVGLAVKESYINKAT